MAARNGEAGNTVRTTRTVAGHWEFDPPLRTRLLVMQPTAFCNIACDYCYLAGRDDRRLMSDEVVSATAANLSDAGLLTDCLGVIWHAGEPLVAPIRFYEAAFATFASRIAAHVNVQHSIQTNATLIDERWCELFERWKVRLGVSIDGPAHIHDKHRKTRSGKRTHALVLRGIEALQRAGIPFHVIAVVTRDSLDSADEIIEYFAALGVREICFNVDEQEGLNAHSSVADAADKHRSFIRRLVDLQQIYHDRLSIRELALAARLIQEGLPRIRLDGHSLPDNAQVTPFAILSVAANGDFSTLSPELVDQSHPRYGSFTFGNVLTDSIASLLENERFRLVFAETLAGIERCRRSCQFFAFCGGGAPANKLAEHGTLDSDETAYCRAVVQRPLEAMLEHYESILFAPAASPPIAKLSATTSA